MALDSSGYQCYFRRTQVPRDVFHRNVTAGQEAVADIIQGIPDACVECHQLNLASFGSVRSFARRAVGDRPLSALVHNAGVMAPRYETTVDGHELTFQVNHLSPFLLTDILLPNLRRAHQDSGDLSRVVLVSSNTHRWVSPSGRGDARALAIGAGVVSDGATGGAPRGWKVAGRWRAYATSKFCNVLYTAELTKRYCGEGSGVVGVAVRPGTVATNITRHSFLLRLLFAVAHPLLTPVEESGEAVARAATDPHVVPGGYYDRSKLRSPSAAAKDKTLQEALWEVTQNVLVSEGWSPAHCPRLDGA